MDIKSIVKEEIATDPMGLGYATKSDAEIASLLNSPDLGAGVKNRGVVPSYVVINATDPTDWKALTADEKLRYQTITGAGQVDTSDPNIRAIFSAMFGAGTTTRSNFLALLSIKCSRAEALGVGHVSQQDIASILRG